MPKNLILELSSKEFEDQILAENTKGNFDAEETVWLTSAIKTHLGLAAGTKPYVSDFAFRRLNAKISTLKLDGNLLGVSKIDGLVAVHTLKPQRAKKLNAWA